MQPLVRLKDRYLPAVDRPALLRSAAVASLLTLVVITRVVVGFAPYRVKLVETPERPVDGLVTIEATPAAAGRAELSVPFAIIARLHNESPQSHRFAIRVDDRLVCEVTVGGESTARTDCASRVDWPSDRTHVVTVGGPGADWSLDYLEIATHHGATLGRDLLILPAGSTHFDRPPLAAAVLIWLAVAGLMLVPAGGSHGTARLLRERRWGRIAHGVLAAGVAGFLAVTVVSPLVSPFLVCVSLSSFLVYYVPLLLAPRIWQTVVLIRASARTPGGVSVRTWASAAATALVVFLVFHAVMAAQLEGYGGNYSGFLQIARRTLDANPTLRSREDVRQRLIASEGGGYDAQFQYYTVWDPFLRTYHDAPARYNEFIDAPPYRYGRIGYALLTRLLSGGDWTRFPVTMVWLLLGATVVCSLAVSAIAYDAGRSPAWGLMVIAIPGFWMSLQSGLPEPLAAAGVLAGYWCLTRSRLACAAILFAATLLVRETAVLYLLVFAFTIYRATNWRAAAAVVAVSVAPVLLWRLYVGAVLYPAWGVEAFTFHPDDLTWPLGGIVDVWSSLVGGRYYPGAKDVIRAGWTYPVVLLAGTTLAFATAAAGSGRVPGRAAFRFAPSAPGAAGVAAAAYGMLALSLNYSSIWIHVGNAQRGTFELFLALLIASASRRGGRDSLSPYRMAFWALAVAYVLYLQPGAEFLRSAVTGLVL